MRQRSWRTAVIATGLFWGLGGASAQDLGRLLPGAEVGDGGRVELPDGGSAPGDEGSGQDVLVDDFRGVRIEGDISVGGGRELQEQLGQSVGGSLSVGELIGMMDKIVAHYAARGFPVVEVLVPEQEVTDGWITLEVVEGKVGDLALSGGKHLNAGRIARRLGLGPGEKLTMRGLQGELDWLNRNRFYDARLVVAPGDDTAEADLLFQLGDARPLRVFGGFENSGVEVVGEERWFAGFEWGDVLGLGHRLIYQATLGTDLDAFRAHALDYRIPLAWQHELGLLAAVVNSETLLEDGVSTSGESWILGANYTVPLRRRGDLRHEASAGFELKSTDNNLEFGGAEVFDSAAELAHFVGRYRAALDRDGRRTSMLAEVFYSPGDLTDANRDVALRGIRADAVSEYTFLRGQVRHVRRLPAGASLIARAGGQWSDAPLLPSEQLALGGYDRVRGYTEREGLGDKGYWGSLEVRAPAIEGDLQLLAFVDYGRAKVDGGGPDRELASAGPGLRYRIGEHLSVRFDYGWQLDGGGSHGHVGVQVEF